MPQPGWDVPNDYYDPDPEREPDSPEMIDAELDGAVRKAMDSTMPAFPSGNPEQGGYSGMSLRDWFAGQALAGILSGEPEDFDRRWFLSSDYQRQQLAERAFTLADEMLKARAGTGMIAPMRRKA